MSISDRLDQIEAVAAYLDDDDMEAEVLAATAALCAVLDLHKPRNGHDDCGHCVDPADAHWGIPWPCPTVLAVEAAIGEES